MKQSHKLELRLNTDLLSVKKENGFEIYRLPVPDIVMLPHMELSRIHSVLEQIREKEKYLVYIREAEQLAEGKNYFEALKRIDAILALKNHEHDPAALALRSELDAVCG